MAHGKVIKKRKEWNGMEWKWMEVDRKNLIQNFNLEFALFLYVNICVASFAVSHTWRSKNTAHKLKRCLKDNFLKTSNSTTLCRTVLHLKTT